MSFNEWKTYSLDELVEVKYGKNHKRLADGKIPVYGSGGIMRFAEKSLYESESILIPRKGTLNNIIYVNAPFWSVDTMFYTKIGDNVNGKFLYYFLKTFDFAAMNVGSAVPSMTTEILNKLEVSLPNKATQNRIASILSSLDDAIELNRQTNQTLEEMAKTLFQEWFVNFNFPNSTDEMQASELGDIPKGWRVGKLGDVLEIKYGKDHKHLQDGIFPVYGSGGIMRYAEKSLYENESILIPRKGTLSNLFYINKPFWTVDTMFYSKIKIKNSGKYMYHLLQTLNLASMNVGSAVPSLTTELLNKIQIVIPDENTLKEFDEIVSSLFIQIEYNIFENQTLSALRDTLLPKLMKGEIGLNYD